MKRFILKQNYLLGSIKLYELQQLLIESLFIKNHKDEII